MTARSDRLRISGHRYLMRRAEAALLTGNLTDDPDWVATPRRWFAGGAILAAVALAACAVLPALGPARPGG